MASSPATRTLTVAQWELTLTPIRRPAWPAQTAASAARTATSAGSADPSSSSILQLKNVSKCAETENDSARNAMTVTMRTAMDAREIVKLRVGTLARVDPLMEGTTVISIVLTKLKWNSWVRSGNPAVW